MTDKDAEQTPTGLRAMTVEEVREQFLDHVVTLAKYWSEQPKDTELERCLGLAHSLLATISGRSYLPGFDLVCSLVCSPHPEDEQYHRDNGENWFPKEDINDGDLNGRLYWRPDGSRRPGTFVEPGVPVYPTTEQLARRREVSSRSRPVSEGVYNRGAGTCRSAMDGDCDWEECPQTRDGEPQKSGRHCPLWKDPE